MYYENLISKRLGGKDFYKNSYYKFEKYSQLKRECQKQFPNNFLFDFGIGESDLMPPQEVLDELAKQCYVYENRIYADNGITPYLEACLIHLKEVYGLENLSIKNINPCIGAKSALTIIPMAFVDDDDYIISTIPGYDVLGNFAKWLNGKIYYAPLLEKNDYLVDLDKIPLEVLKKTKLFIVNYPNNPTGAVSNKLFFEKLINLALTYNFLIVNDIVYGPLSKNPLSIFNCQNAYKCCIEVHSFSKAFNMTGMRIGFMLANQTLINILKMVKDNMDSGQYIPIMYAAIKAVEIEKDYLPKLYKRFQKRKELISQVLKKHNLQIKVSEATFYLFLKVPKSFASGDEFCRYLLEKFQIFVLPWDEVEPSVRLSMTFKSPNDDDELFAKLLDERLKIIF